MSSESPMIEAWYMDDSDDDQRLPHRLEPNKPVTLLDLSDIGVMHWRIRGSWQEDELLKWIRNGKEGGEDIITCSPEELPNYETTLKSFFEEHLHIDEEIRFIVDGSGYFDVRDKSNRWIRVHCHKGDLLVMPAGIYHRFTLDTRNYIKALRLYSSEPGWVSHKRPAEDTEARKRYIQKYLAQAVKSQ